MAIAQRHAKASLWGHGQTLALLALVLCSNLAAGHETFKAAHVKVSDYWGNFEGLAARPPREEAHELNKEEGKTEEELEEELWDEEEEAEPMGEAEHIDIAIGCMLLGSVIMQMSLIYIMNYPDEDIMRSAWEVISSTLSIFVSVLNFHAFRELAVYLEVDSDAHPEIPGYMKDLLRIGTFMCVFVGLFCIMHLVIAKQIRLNRTILPEDEIRLRGTQPMRKETAKQRRMRITKSWAILLSHTSAFAGIHLGVEIQHILRSWAYSTLFVPVLAVGCYFVIFRISAWYRCSHTMSNDDLGEEAHAEWDEEAEEAEKEIASISVSFLAVHACRFLISGVLAHANGKEMPQEVHPLGCVLLLLLVGFIFYGFTVLLVFANAEDLLKEQAEMGQSQWRSDTNAVGTIIEMDTWGMYTKRWQMLFPKIVATCGSWCLLWACKWIQVMLPAPSSLYFAPDSTLMCVLLALGVSMAMFGFVVALDKLADLDVTGPICDLTIRSIIDSLGVLVGFTWETSFSSGLEGIAELSRCYGPHMPLLVQAFLAVSVSIIVVPAWRSHILKKVLILIAAQCGAPSPGGSPTRGRSIESLMRDEVDMSETNNKDSELSGLLPTAPGTGQAPDPPEQLKPPQRKGQSCRCFPRIVARQRS